MSFLFIIMIFDILIFLEIFIGSLKLFEFLFYINTYSIFSLKFNNFFNKLIINIFINI
jgi:hypothetical protein